MAISRSKAAAGFGMVLAGVALFCGPAQAAPAHASYAVAGPRTSVPYGWVDFCNRYATDCDVEPLSAVDVDLTAGAMKDLERVNRQVNAAIKPETDMDHWGVVDRWDYPMDGKGDCEDYALLKRKILMSAGYPRQALLMTVVKDHEGEGHAILTVKTNRGEYVLDNLDDRVMAWSDTGYTFIKRQSQEDPNLWQSIGVPAPAPPFTAR